MRGLRLPLLCEWGLRFYGIWRSVDRYLRIYRRFGTAYRSYLQGSSSSRRNCSGLLDLRSETSVTTNKPCVTSQKIDDLVGGELSLTLQLYYRQKSYILQYC